MYAEAEEAKLLSMPKINAAMAYGQKIIKMGEVGNHVVVCWGPTGAGKSSCVLTLSGERMLGYHKQGNPILMNKDSINFDVQQHQAKVQAQEQLTKIFIQEKAFSGTKYPIVLSMKTQPHQPTVKLWDTAGFSDNTGHTQTLINAYFLNRIFNLQQKVKLIFCVNFASLAIDLKGQFLRRDILRLTEILQDFPNYNKSMALLVTKVPPSADRDDIRGLLKENMEVILNQDKKNKQLKKFFDFVHNDKMPFMILRRPQLVGKVSQDRPTDVTDQYEEFKREFYFLVVNQLQAATFPKITVPAGLAPEQRRECEDLAIQTAELIRKQIVSFVEKLTPFTLTPYNFAMSDNDEVNRSNFAQLAKMKNFIKSLASISRKTEMNSSEECSHTLQQIRQLFQDPTHSFCCSKEQGQLTCKPLKKLCNSFITIQFLESIKLGDRCDGVRYERMVELLLEAFQNEIRTVEQQSKGMDKQVEKKVKLYISNKISAHLTKWKKEQLYTIWKKKVRDFPCFFLSVSKFNPHVSKIQDYCQYLIQKEEQFCMKNHHEIELILQTLGLSQRYLDVNPDTTNFTANQLAPVVEQTGRKLIRDQSLFDSWQEEDLLGGERMDGTKISQHIDPDTANRKKPMEQLVKQTKQNKQKVERCLNDIKKNENRRGEMEMRNGEEQNAKQVKMQQLREQLEQIQRESRILQNENANLQRQLRNKEPEARKRRMEREDYLSEQDIN